MTEGCDPPGACNSHGRCWMHSTEDKCDCGSNDFAVSATLIKCKACGRTWGRVNGTWVLDPDTVPGVQKIARDHRARIEGLDRERALENQLHFLAGAVHEEWVADYVTEAIKKIDERYVAAKGLRGTTVAEAGSKPCGLSFDELTAACKTIKTPIDTFVALLQSLPRETRVEVLSDVLDKCCCHCGSFSAGGGELGCNCTNDE